MYTQTVKAKIIGMSPEPKFFGGANYRIAYETIEGPAIITSSRVVPFEDYSRLTEGSIIDLDIFSSDGLTWADSIGKATLDAHLGVFIHPALR